MQGILIKIMPVFPGDYMTERIKEIVCHHLRFTGSSGSEIEKGDIIVAVRAQRTAERCRILYA